MNDFEIRRRARNLRAALLADAPARELRERNGDKVSKTLSGRSMQYYVDPSDKRIKVRKIDDGPRP